MKVKIGMVFNVFKAENLLLILFLFVTIYFYSNAISETKFIQDDAFTSLRYVSNLVEGNGLVFNTGERVEGYTNFLWVLILSASALVFRTAYPGMSLTDFLPVATQVFSIFFGMTLLLITYLLAKKMIHKDNNSPIIYHLLNYVQVILVLFSTPFIYWSVSGMETSLFVTLTLTSILFSMEFSNRRARIIFVFVSILNSFLRPEGIIFFFLIISYEIIERAIDGKGKKIYSRLKNTFNKEIISALMFYSFPIFFYMIFRLFYYGYPFPNTFYAKTEFSIEFLERGLRYFISFVRQYFIFGGLFIPVLIQVIRKQINREEKVILWFTINWIILVIFIGGDVLPINRFFLPLMPIIFILTINSCKQMIEEFLPVKMRILFLVILTGMFICYAFFNYNLNKPEMMEKRAYESGLVSKMKIYADYVREYKIKHFNKNGKKNKISVAMSTIGAFSFYSGVDVIDIVGLTDEYIAHNPRETEGIDEQLPVLWKERHYNAGYVISSKPDFIIFPAGAKPSAFAECALFVQPEFYKDYYAQLFYSDALRQLLPIITRKENVRRETLVCDNRFLKYYIEANNIFLKMLETKNRKMINELVFNLDEMIKICPSRITEANTLKGMAFYHLGNNIIAQKYLSDSVEKDSTNSIAKFYLMNIYRQEGSVQKAINLIPKIEIFSPDAMPKLFPN